MTLGELPLEHVHSRPWRVLLRWPVGLGPLLVGVICSLPVVFLLVSTFVVSPPGTPTQYGFGNWTSAFGFPGSAGAIAHSIELSFTREALAIPIALLFTWLIARTDMPGRRVVEAAAWLSIFIPILPLTLGWILLLDPHYGLINRLTRAVVGRGLFDIYGFWGITWVYLATNAVWFKVVLLAPMMRGVGQELEEAGRMCGASRLRTFRSLVLPLLAPGLLFVSVTGLVFSLQGFQVELLLGDPVRYHVYSTQIYNLVNNTPPQDGQAAVLGTVFLLVLLALTAVYRRYLTGRSFVAVSGRGYRTRPTPLGPWRWPAAVACLLAIGVTVGLPFTLLVVGSFMRVYGFFNVGHAFSFSAWHDVLSNPAFLTTLRNSGIICSAAATGVVIVYLLVAHAVLRRPSSLGRAADQLLWAPWATPGILMSLGLLGLFLDTPLRSVLFGSILGLVVAYVIQHAPLSSQLFKASLLQLGPDLEESARVCGARKGRVIVSILGRVLAPTVVAVAILTFLMSLQDIPTAVLLYSPKSEPLSILMLDYAVGGSEAQSAVVGVMTTLIAVGVLLLLRSVVAKAVVERKRDT